MRLDLNNDSDNYQYYKKSNLGLNNMQKRLNAYGGTDQWTRMREDKLKGLKKALLYSYQSAVVQKYDVQKDTLAHNLAEIISSLENNIELTAEQQLILDNLEEEYTFLSDERQSLVYLNELDNIYNSLIRSEPYFRCLINHDKLKVDYEDKIISIPFEQPPIGGIDAVSTDFHNGTVFKWVHGNKEEWTPDTYWIVYMQYSQETAYFRAEIRKADEEIEIVIIDNEGNQSTSIYRGWMTGPNETTVGWNVKKDLVWNDLNYTKLLYITKDEDTLAFFQRFDRIIINGKPWEVQAYNESYSTNKNMTGVDTGIIRVALKETYTSTDQFIKQSLIETDETQEEESAGGDPEIVGPTAAKPYDIIKYTAKNFDNTEAKEWTLYDTSLAKIIDISQDQLTATIEILTGFSNSQGFYINYGNSTDTIKHIIIKSN